MVLRLGYAGDVGRGWGQGSHQAGVVNSDCSNVGSSWRRWNLVLAKTLTNWLGKLLVQRLALHQGCRGIRRCGGIGGGWMRSLHRVGSRCVGCLQGVGGQGRGNWPALV